MHFHSLGTLSNPGRLLASMGYKNAQSFSYRERRHDIRLHRMDFDGQERQSIRTSGRSSSGSHRRLRTCQGSTESSGAKYMEEQTSRLAVLAMTRYNTAPRYNHYSLMLALHWHARK
jgi:hypothetical protein